MEINDLPYSAKELFRSPVIDDNTNLSTLSIIDLLRVIIKALSKNDEAELNAQERINKDKLKKIGSLRKFIENSISEMKEKKKTSVTTNMSSTYLPYIDEVINNKTGLGRFYNFKISRNENIPLTIEHKFILRISLKDKGGDID